MYPTADPPLFICMVNATRAGCSRADMTARTSVGVAVLGAGYWGPNLIRNFERASHSELRWVCDLDLDRARHAIGTHSTVRPTDTLDDVLDDADVTAVAIATPVSTHTEVAMACLEAGKHVLI